VILAVNPLPFFRGRRPQSAGVAQLVERLPSKQNVAGPSPVARSDELVFSGRQNIKFWQVPRRSANARPGISRAGRFCAIIFITRLLEHFGPWYRLSSGMRLFLRLRLPEGRDRASLYSHTLKHVL
jgi:hypothetical protein